MASGWFFLFSLLASLLSGTWCWSGPGFHVASPPPRCEPISIPMCLGIGYNLTRMPNLLGHTGQAEASLALQAFAPLVSYGCHARLRFFLCSLFAPMCTEQVPRAIPACRPMCEAARRRCGPVLAHFRFEWPPALDCARLPTRHDPHALCMEDPDAQDEEEGDGLHTDTEDRPQHSPQRRGYGMLPVAPPPPPAVPSSGPVCASAKLLFVRGLGACLPRCTPSVDVFWSRHDKALASSWACAWAALCFASTAFALLTFLLEPRRFRYPERPIAFLCVCYNAHAAGFLLRGLAGSERLSCGEDADSGARFLLPTGTALAHAPCALAFLLTSFPGMASSCWWAVLALAWFLAAGKKWGHEAIGALSRYFHLAAWGLPAIQSAAALALGAVSADELTGLCAVSASGGSALSLVLVLAPLAACLFAGTSFLLAGFTALFRIRRTLKTEGSDTQKLERLMLRLGLFSLLYALPASAVLGCLLYESAHAQRWAELAWARACAETEGEEPDCRLPASIPAAPVFLLKICMSFAVGISSGAWVWSPKTLQAWQGLCRKKARGPPRKEAQENSHFRRKAFPKPEAGP
ncbi:frizzled-9-like [Anolis sagrei]|uniref:frizzled-9-like n=1 Tax=Anolis sagrei TaxID=38937 RepID=UPI00352160B0